MSLIAGASGSKTILTDGVQVNVINENTVTNGVQIQGRTSGTAIASGYVGQIITASGINVADFGGCTTDGVVETKYTTITDPLSLTAGVWMIILSGYSYVSVGISVNNRYALLYYDLYNSSDSSVVKTGQALGQMVKDAGGTVNPISTSHYVDQIIAIVNISSSKNYVTRAVTTTNDTVVRFDTYHTSNGLTAVRIA